MSTADVSRLVTDMQGDAITELAQQQPTGLGNAGTHNRVARMALDFKTTLDGLVDAPLSAEQRRELSGIVTDLRTATPPPRSTSNSPTPSSNQS